MTKTFDADAVLKYADEQGITLLPWQRATIRSMATGTITHRSRKAGMTTIRTLVEDATRTPPPPGLPATVDYHHVITLLTALLPDLDAARVSEVSIDHADVRVQYWDGQAVATHTIPIEHEQGSATEGGHPTTPPTGITDLDGSDAQ